MVTRWEGVERRKLKSFPNCAKAVRRIAAPTYTVDSGRILCMEIFSMAGFRLDGFGQRKEGSVGLMIDIRAVIRPRMAVVMP